MLARTICFALAAVGTLAACGGNTATAASRNSGGTGSLNLLVKADVDAVVSSAGSATDLVVTVQDRLGNKVSGASVSIVNQTWGTVALAETGAGSGDYRKTQPSFPPGDFALTVTCNPCTVAQSPSISGGIQGVVVGGPGPHAINYPSAGGSVPAGQPVQVGWTTPTQAAYATITTNSFGPVTATDNGTYTIPGTGNPAATSQSLNIARYNEVAIAGGVSNSRMRVIVEANVAYSVK
jgi:hypothetical protein